MEKPLAFLDIDEARRYAHQTARTNVRLFNSSDEQIYQFPCFLYGLHYNNIEHLRNQVAYATIEAPQHTATGWGMKG